MTFLEAAIEVLRRADGPLHFAEITRRAVEGELLSHVGRDPEAAMKTCLHSAGRTQSGVVPGVEPGTYVLAEGARSTAPESDPEGSTGEAHSDVVARTSTMRSKGSPSTSRKGGAADAFAREVAEAGDSFDRAERRQRRRAGVRGVAQEEAPTASEPIPDLQFEAPSEAGLGGVTDVALVMANAMSRIVGERPELRSEFEAMQADQRSAAASGTAGPVVVTRPRAVRPGPERLTQEDRDDRDDRGGRRRRRRKRRGGRRVEWVPGGGQEAGPGTEPGGARALLDAAAEALGRTEGRAQHIRQLAEALAARGVLGGELSEIERALTSAILMDVRALGRASRFAVRGDARYQLQGARLPEAVAAAERAIREAALAVERESRRHLELWLGSLGARALETVARMYLETEGHRLTAALPPARGLARLVIEEADAEEDESRTLVAVVPRKTTLEPKALEADLEARGCASCLVIAGGDVAEEALPPDTRVIAAPELAAWMWDKGIGVQPLRLELTVLDPGFVESVGGLDT